MSNRSASSAPLEGALLVRQAVAADFSRHARHAPAYPKSWPALLKSLAHGLLASQRTDPATYAALLDLRAAIFTAPGRDSEALALWREAIATAAFASQLAEIRRVAPGAAACGALLHRAGEAIAVKYLALAEAEHHVHLDGASVAELRARHGRELAQRLAHEWRLTERIVDGMLRWHRFGEAEGNSREAVVIYFGHMLAVELLYPQFASPSALDSASAELGLNVETLEWVRGESRAIRELLDALQ